MLIDRIKARDLKIELFEQETIVLLQAEVEEWLESRTEELIVGMEFESGVPQTLDSYRAYIFYTE